MHPKVLVLVKKDGLNHNLLRLALDSQEFHLSFLEPTEVDSRHFQQSDCLVVDDSAFKSFGELQETLKAQAQRKKLIYLSHEIPSEFKSREHPDWSFMRKPFNPVELKALLAS